MTVLYVTYRIEGATEHRALAIHLRQQGTNTPTHELLRELHAAADAWNERNQNLFVRADLGIEPEAGAICKELSAYQYSSGAVNPKRLARHLDMVLARGRIHTFTPRPGGLVEGPDLVGREATVSALRTQLAQSSAHLMAPRRYGKTSVLRHLVKVLTAAGEPCLFVDVSPGPGPSWLLVTLVQEAMEHGAIRETVGGLPELAGWPKPGSGPGARNRAGRGLEKDISSNIWSFGRRLLEELGRAGAVLLLDEFSVFLRRALERNPDGAGVLCDLLVESRTAQRPTRQVLAGSAGLSSFLHFHGLEEKFSDLVGVELPPLIQADAAVLAEELIYGERQSPSPEIVDRILAVVGEPIPYFVHALVAAACEIAGERGGLSVEVVRDAYLEILGPRGNPHFADFRLDRQPYPRELRKAASGILLELANTPDGVSGESLRQLFLETAGATQEARYEPLLSCLREDYDLVERGDGWVMRSKVLRDRWGQGEPWLTGEVG